MHFRVNGVMILWGEYRLPWLFNQKQNQVELAVLCIVSNQMALGQLIIILGTFQNLKPLKIPSTQDNPYLPRPDIKSSGQIINSILNNDIFHEDFWLQFTSNQ